MPTKITHWFWEEAFNKFGFGDGDELVYTQDIANFIEELGYKVEYNGWGVHNTIIDSIKTKDDDVIMDWESLESWGLEMGYSDPREYLPKDLVKKLDEKFDEDYESDLY